MLTLTTFRLERIKLVLEIFFVVEQVRKKYIVGEVKEETSKEYGVKLHCKKSTAWKFIFPEVIDKDVVHENDIVSKLLVPETSRRTQIKQKTPKQKSWIQPWGLYINFNLPLSLSQN